MPQTSQPLPHPNVLWIFADQLRWHALSCNGDPNIKTPNIDRLAREGVRFTHSFSQYPVCMPFRGGLITGQHAHINGVRVHGDMLAPTPCTVANAFRAAGYRTSWVGKWHLASNQGIEGWNAGADYWVHPYLRAGFEDWYGFDCSNHFYNTRYCHGDSIWPPLEVKGYQTDGLTDISLEYLQNTAANLSQPWFHCLSVEAPHGGTDADGSYGNPAPEEYCRLFDPQKLTLRANVPQSAESYARPRAAGYYAQIANLDHNVGRVLDWLDASGQAENTLVVFFADHGEIGGSHGMYEKVWAWDESIRIPLLMRLPGTLEAGKTDDQLVSGIDLFPTTAGLCGVPVPNAVQGLDLSSSIRNLGGVTQSEVLVQWLGAARYGFGDFAYRAIRTHRYTYCVGTTTENCMLFDNENDEYQMQNLYGNPEAVDLQSRLHNQLRQAIIRSGEAIPEFIL